MQNRRKSYYKKYKGTWYEKSIKRWRTRIRVNGTVINLGCYKTEEEAHAAYAIAAHKYHREFAHE